ncbi:Cof-type HAD-IIB family hydrolase [Singulisphaera sp. PoT]|uniref:Cof-type HAD-IIB family hydrolase n=1 Tax=Singulisphaera sp. PoT TaxID=3411797 RepID=UPI003BF4BED0
MGGRFRILALDVDGTLLDSHGRLRASTAAAVARAAEAGIRPVLCTGRRYRRARPVAEQLGLDAPLVCNSGAIVKDPADHKTLWKADFDGDLFAEILRLFHENDEPAVSFLDRRPEDFDFLVDDAETGRPHFDEYLRKNLEHALVEPGWHLRTQEAGHYHVCAIGSRPSMLAFQEVILSALEGRVRTFVQKSPRYVGTMCEVLRHDASKWEALLHLAELWGITPEEICAVGDDMNDLPMIEGAGFGVAMGHAPAAVLAAADHVTGDHDNDGVSMVVELLLSA